MSDMFTRVRKISAKERAELHLRANAGEALFLWELAVVLGYSYAVLLNWKRDDLPLVDGKLPKGEAWAWRKVILANRRSAAKDDQTKACCRASSAAQH